MLPWASTNILRSSPSLRINEYTQRTVKARGRRFKSLHHEFNNRRLATQCGLGTANKQIAWSRDKRLPYAGSNKMCEICTAWLKPYVSKINCTKLHQWSSIHRQFFTCLSLPKLTNPQVTQTISTYRPSWELTVTLGTQRMATQKCPIHTTPFCKRDFGHRDTRQKTPSLESICRWPITKGFHFLVQHNCIYKTVPTCLRTLERPRISASLSQHPFLFLVIPEAQHLIWRGITPLGMVNTSWAQISSENPKNRLHIHWSHSISITRNAFVKNCTMMIWKRRWILLLPSAFSIEW